jgi:hypothetical protein
MVIICLTLNIKRKYIIHKDDSLAAMCAKILKVKNLTMRHSYYCDIWKYEEKL